MDRESPDMNAGYPGTLAVRHSLQSPGLAYEAAKRMLDITGALLCLIASLPVLLLCMGWIKLVDGGPVLYRQWRAGRDGWLFEMYKLRTMNLDAESDGVRYASDGDPRVLPGCKWVRRSHIDELPQLWHILMGQMSLVGPRPERPEIIEQLRGVLPGIDRRLAVSPGLTGLAQVRNGYTNDLNGMRRKMAYDLRYLRRRTLRNDLQVLLETVPKIWDRSAC